MSDDLERWLSVGDLDELLREVDRRCDRGDWDGVQTIRMRARAAIERGHQLWPAASFAEYRLALDAPPGWAASVITDDAGYMGPGPLSEVVAQRHSWADLAESLPISPRRALVAQERVLRGEEVPDAHAGELPGRLSAWEPDYLLPAYHSDGSLEVPSPQRPPPGGPVLECPSAAHGACADADADADAEDGALALLGALRHWSASSGGTVRAAGVQGGALDALAALGHREAMLQECTLAEAAALLAWGAADGAAHGRRRGAATGRFELWWCLSVLAGVEDEWPGDPGPHAARLRCAVWSPREPAGGWSCRLVFADDDDGLAWALDAYEPSPA
jgi:hypothetical protein